MVTNSSFIGNSIKFGNPISEVFTGQLTGEETQESYVTRRVFSEDGKNLLLREESENGKVVCFTYLPNTNLQTSKLTKDGERILLREFFVYDESYNLIQTISDNGSSENDDCLENVTQRTLKKYILRLSAPFLHMPEWIEEVYLENGNEKLLKKSHLFYDPYGNIAHEEVYDADANHAYTISKTFNERGDILPETNPLGQQATYTYDERGRLITTTNFSNRKQKTLRYDTKGRLCEVIEKGEDGIVHKVTSEYDAHDRRIHKKDAFEIAYTMPMILSLMR